jgi:hypothetical protein
MSSEPTLGDVLEVCRDTHRLIERRPTESQVRIIVSDEVRQAMAEHRDSCVPRAHFHDVAQQAAETAGKVEAMGRPRSHRTGDSVALKWAKILIPAILTAAGSFGAADYFGWFR